MFITSGTGGRVARPFGQSSERSCFVDRAAAQEWAQAPAPSCASSDWGAGPVGERRVACSRRSSDGGAALGAGEAGGEAGEVVAAAAGALRGREGEGAQELAGERGREGGGEGDGAE